MDSFALKQIKLLLLLSLMNQSAWAAGPDVSCQERAQLFTDRLIKAAPDSTQKQLTELISTRTPDLVIFGELHPTLSESKFYPQWTQNLSTLFKSLKPGQLCIFLESRGSDFSGKQFDQNVLKAYRNQGFKLIGVDQPGVATIDERTAYMAKSINEAFENGVCASGAAFLGKGHLEDVGTGNVQKLITVKQVSVDIVSTDFALSDQPGEDSVSRMLRKFMDQKDILWRHCQASQNVDIQKIESSIAIVTSDLTQLPITKNRRMIDVYQDGPFWNTYDLLIVSNPK